MGIFNFLNTKKNTTKVSETEKPVNFNNLDGYNDNIESISKIIKKDKEETTKFNNVPLNLKKNTNVEKTIPFNVQNTQKILSEQVSKIQETEDTINFGEPSLTQKLRNARKKVNELQKDMPNENEELISRLKKRREMSKDQVRQQDFQKVLDDIKRRNFDQRMTRMHERIKLANRDNKNNSFWEETRNNLKPDSLLHPSNRQTTVIPKRKTSLKVNATSEKTKPLKTFVKPTKEKTEKYTQGEKQNSGNWPPAPNYYKNPEKNKIVKDKNIEQNKINVKNGMHPSGEKTVTMTVSQLNKIVKNTVDDVINNIKVKDKK